MPRFMTPDRNLKLISVDFDERIIPSTFEHAPCDLIDNETDLESSAQSLS